MALFFGVGERIFEIGIFNLAATLDGFNLGFLVFSRIMGGFSCLAFLTLTTPMNEMFFIFEGLKVPKIVIEIAMLMYRYIFLFLEEAENMYNSQKTRMGYGSIKNTYKSLGMLSSNLFIRTWLKGEQAYIAMESRCYDGSIKSFKTYEDIGIKNIALLLSFESFLLLGVYLTSGFKII
jgi:cobalt/nickel transport system permease protein